MASLLTTPIDIGPITLRNRLWLAPMCQYSVTAEDGTPTDWHLVHLGARASGGFGLVIAEATAVSPEARISPQDTGIWDDAQITAWSRIVDFIHSQGAKAGIQLAHAGRKSSTYPALPAFADHAGTVPASDGGWQTVGPTDVPFPELDAPRALSTEEVQRVVQDFAAAAGRAVAAGFDVIELHGAHGYLIHQFLSPLVNTRSDEYGGSLDGRTRLAREITEAVRSVLPADRALTIRISGTDWADGGWDVASSIELTLALENLGLDAVHVSSGGAVPAPISIGPGYQSGLAQQIKAAVHVPVATVGLITEPAQAESLLRTEAADVIAVGRAALRDPHWALNATRELERDPQAASDLSPGQYVRAYR